MASSSAILRRLMCHNGAAGILRSRIIPAGDAYTYGSPCCRRMMSSAPWMMLPPSDDRSGNRFKCVATNEQVVVGWRLDSDLKLVGSSHGWLALYNPQSHDLSLTDPISARVIKLPPVPEDTFVNSVVLSSENQGEGEGGLAFMSFGPRGNLGFCSPGRSNEWSLFDVGGKRVFNNMVYSRRHKRLFCITETAEDCRWWGSSKIVKLESWDVGADDNDNQSHSPRLEWMLGTKRQPTLTHSGGHITLNYIVCEEQTGELFMVTGAVLNQVVRFSVYKIDRRRGKLTEMYSWKGLAMYVGINHSLAIPATKGGIYFTYDNRLNEGGISNYQHPYPYPYPYPVWFTPRSNL